jgi:hypothetical protein
MTTSLATAQGADSVPPVTVPDSFDDFAFEYKLGWAAGTNPAALNPVKRSDFYGVQRRDAWKAGYLARRQSLGFKNRLRPLTVTRAAR